MDIRLDQIKQWLEDINHEIKFIEPASNDASFRRYFRVGFDRSKTLSIDETYIIMDAPPEKESLDNFIKTTNLFSSLDIHVPKIYDQNISNGFLLLEDFGCIPYLSVLNEDNSDKLYQEAMNVLLKLKIEPDFDETVLPHYDESLLRSEMNLFEDWFIKVHIDYQLEQIEKGILEETLSTLVNEISQQEQVIVHRDFHSRNLMFIDDDNPGVIDYQDAVIGPCTYDLVSLIRDSYIQWPEDKINQWISEHHQNLLEQKIITQKDPANYKQWVDMMGMQRQIKVVGIFARLYHRDGKENYLKDIPLTYKNLLNTSRQYSEFREFSDLIEKLYQKYLSIN